MKALSLWQPWASAIALGLKRIETRSWSTSYRGSLAIHAAKRWTADEREFHALEHEAGRMPAELPLGAIVAVVRLAAVRPTGEVAHRLSPDELAWGNYGPDRFAWVLEDVRTLPAPIPFRGAQGLFVVPDMVFGPGYTPPPAPELKPVEPPRQGALL